MKGGEIVMEYDQKKIESLIKQDEKRKAYNKVRNVWKDLMVKKAQENGVVVSKEEIKKEIEKRSKK